jgi:YegS/Rv2252/BmrU family lipid kinase
MRSAAIINPSSGGGRTIKIWRQLGESLTRKLDGLKIYFTEKSGHATELARLVAKEGYDRLIVVGGDGTLHECINGLIENDKPLYKPDFKLGILNGGRGCDYTKTIQIPDDPHKMLEVCLGVKFQPVDIGRVDLGGKIVYYMNSSTFGLGGVVAKAVQGGSSILPPSASYLTATVKHVLGALPHKIKIQLDGKPFYEGLAHNVFVCNGKYSGGGMLWAPDAKLDDGLFNVLIVKDISRLELLTLAPRLYTGTISKARGIDVKVASSVSISAVSPTYVELDGETYPAERAEYSILNQALDILC